MPKPAYPTTAAPIEVHEVRRVQGGARYHVHLPASPERPVLDASDGYYVLVRPRIIGDITTGPDQNGAPHVWWAIQGGGKTTRRYHDAPGDVEAAMAHIRKWARGRFRVRKPEEGRP